MRTKLLKLRASSAAFIKGRTVYTDFRTGCIRNLLFKAYGIDESFKPDTAARGAANEDRFAEKTKGLDFARELDSPCVSVTPTVAWGGRSDFLRRRPSTDVAADGAPVRAFEAIYELKSTGSKSKLRDLKAGKYTTENLAQLVAYMVDFSVETGFLVYTYYERDKYSGEDKVKYEREFKVTLDSIGTVIVDNVPTMFNVADQLEHRLQAASALEHDIVWDRPHNWDQQWGSPCHFCPFKIACEQYDSGAIETTDGLLSEASKLVGVREE